jgi:tRNA (guanine37-N1)-methyltransferase
MRFDVITLFPELIEEALSYGIVGRALESKKLILNTINPREFSSNNTGRIDDKPYGGGPGMVMESEPLVKAIRKAKQSSDNAHVVYMSPQGKKFSQAQARTFLEKKNIILVSGRYEGIDERVIENEVDEICSIGDFVVSGGEFPILLIIDAVIRLEEGVLGDPDSSAEDSFSNGLLEFPQYTRPESNDFGKVPEILLSGNHKAISAWRLKESLKRTLKTRPDLISNRNLTEEEKLIIDKIKSEENS